MEISEKTEQFKKNHTMFDREKMDFEKKNKNSNFRKNRNFRQKFFVKIFNKFITFYRILKGRIVLKPRKMEISEKTEQF